MPRLEAVLVGYFNPSVGVRASGTRRSFHAGFSAGAVCRRVATAGDLTLIRDLAVVLVSAGIVAMLFHRLRLPLVLGYLTAGVLVGPHLLPTTLIQDPANIEVLAQLGVLFVLFALGLDFHLGKLRRVGGLAVTAGTIETSFMIGVGFISARIAGWSALDALFLGAILAISSTTIITNVLREMGRMRAPSSQAIFGILLVEDLVAVILIALLSSIAITGGITVASIGALLVRILVFVISTLVIGIVVVPRLVDYVARTRMEELLVLLAVGVAFAVSMIAVALDLSLALGAFIAGAIVAESRASATVERRVEPLRDVFAAVFFVSTGILIDPGDIITYWPVILALGAVSILGKFLAVSGATFVAGFPADQAMRVGLGMAMIGEFSFVIAALGRDLGVTSDFLLPVAVSVSALSTLVTPPLMRRADDIVQWLGRHAPEGIVNYARMYSAWVSRARRGDRGEEAFAGGYDIPALVRVLSYAAILVALVVTVRVADAASFATVGGSVLFRAALYVVALLAAVPLVIGLLRALRRLVDSLVYVIIPPRETAKARGAAAAAVLRNTLYAFLAVLAAVVLVAAGAAFVPPLPLLLGGVIVVVVSAFLLRGSLRRLEAHLEGAVSSVFHGKAAPGQRDEVLTFIRERYPWDMHTASLIVPPNSRAANRRIRDLQLPQRTGATIITHERDGAQSVNPAPDVLIEVGDTLGILGERDQVEEAKRLLLSEAPATDRPVAKMEEGVEIEEMEVVEHAPIAGLTLAGSRIRETTGASIVGIRREGVPILNPAPVMRLRPGDSVVVLGSPAQLDAARKLFEPRPIV